MEMDELLFRGPLKIQLLDFDEKTFNRITRLGYNFEKVTEKVCDIFKPEEANKGTEYMQGICYVIGLWLILLFQWWMWQEGSASHRQR